MTAHESEIILNKTGTPKYYINLRTIEFLDGAVRSQLLFNQYNLVAAEFISWMTIFDSNQLGLRDRLKSLRYDSTFEEIAFGTTTPISTDSIALALFTYNFTTNLLKVIIQHEMDPTTILRVYLSYSVPLPKNPVVSFNSSWIKAGRIYANKTISNQTDEDALMNEKIYIVIERTNGKVLVGCMVQTDTDVRINIDHNLNEGQIAVITVACVIIFLMLLIGIVRKFIVSPYLKKRKDRKEKSKQQQQQHELPITNDKL